jgi:release factor glutamine methyltransferase
LRIRDFIEHHQNTGRSDALNIVALVLSMRKEEIFTRLDQELDAGACLCIERLIAERAKGRPYAYLVNKKEFYSEEFHVDEGVLIPRPETETLVEEALAILGERPEMETLLDVGTGSGAIGLILAKKARRRVVCADISMEALRVAKRNSERLETLGLTHFLCSDLFGGITGFKFDMILANLPYVASDEWESLMADVRDYEPRKALDGGKAGMAIYERFVKGLPQHLKEDGHVLCEVGGVEQANTLREMFREIGITARVRKDLAGHERVIIGSWISLS